MFSDFIKFIIACYWNDENEEKSLKKKTRQQIEIAALKNESN